MPRAGGGPRAGRLLGGARRSGRRGLPRVRLGPRARPAGRVRRREPRLLPRPLRHPDRDPIIAGGFWPVGGAQALRELLRTRFVERLGRLWTPVLVVNGALDPVFGPGGDPWAAACRRGRHVVLSRAMHLANLDRPGRSPTSSRRSSRIPPGAPEPTAGASRGCPPGGATGPPVYSGGRPSPCPERFDARPQSRLPGRRLGNPVPSRHEGAAQGDAAARRQAGHPVRGRGSGRRGHRAGHHRHLVARSARSRTTSTSTTSSSTCSRRRARSRSCARSATSATSRRSPTCARRSSSAWATPC